MQIRFFTKKVTMDEIGSGVKVCVVKFQKIGVNTQANIMEMDRAFSILKSL